MSGLGMASLLLCLSGVGQLPSVAPAEPESFLYEPECRLDGKPRGLPAPYELRPGDICFAVNRHIISRIGHRLSGAGLPNHSMIVFRLPDGRMAILEAGPHSKLSLEINDANAHLRVYEDEGNPVWVRRRRVPLTAEQSNCLTRFCLEQDGKCFPVVRLVGQLTPFRSRGPIRTAWMGKPDVERRTYFCSELVLNALVAAGALDPEPLRPSATYPSDLFFNESSNKHVERSLHQLGCDWDLPARWTSCSGR